MVVAPEVVGIGAVALAAFAGLFTIVQGGLKFFQAIWDRQGEKFDKVLDLNVAKDVVIAQLTIQNGDKDKVIAQQSGIIERLTVARGAS